MAVSRTRKKKKNQNRTAPVWEGRTVYGLGEEAAAAGGPSRTNAAAGHRAAEADRRWFERNADASVRVREALPGEHDHRAFGSEPLAPNQKIAVVVVQAAPGAAPASRTRSSPPRRPVRRSPLSNSRKSGRSGSAATRQHP